MNKLGFGFALSALLVCIGCSPASDSSADATTEVAAADPHAGHDHGHGAMGPHGGHLLHLEPTGAHAEWTHDDDAKLITVYLDDFNSADIQSVKFDVNIGDIKQEFALSNAGDGWAITSDELLTHLNMGEAAKVSLVVKTANGDLTTAIEAHDDHAGHSH